MSPPLLTLSESPAFLVTPLKASSRVILQCCIAKFIIRGCDWKWHEPGLKSEPIATLRPLSSIWRAGANWDLPRNTVVPGRIVGMTYFLTASLSMALSDMAIK
ncbi:hypothetical protein FGO68_gene11636 [Halteria grandinella]|uniref:Uncharacterized protein n=1 Tax=Halteria grandinella TaxID=5974 RepID=A0A8J8NIC1_HALGN|nr:hypothetical protein FGO68_gene11636 [Halteria grandinella]